jgi:hypothetical protein
MKKGTKIGLGVAGGILVVGGLIYLFRDQIFPNRQKRKACKKGKGKWNPKINACIKEGEVISENSTNGGNPFSNKEEGNKFRKWMNEDYPKVAEAIKGNGFDTGLDLEGSYDNCHIREAYHKCKVKQGDKCNTTYGEIYMLALRRGDIK